MVPDFTFEIIVRVVEHVTGCGEARECGQEDEPEHGSALPEKRLRCLWCSEIKCERVIASSAEDRIHGPGRVGRQRRSRREAAKIWRQAAAPFLSSVWQPLIGPHQLSTPRLPANDRGKAGVLLSRPITTPEVASIAAKEVTGDILSI